MTSESEVDNPPLQLSRSTRSKPAPSQIATRPDDLRLSDLNLSEQPTAKNRANGKSKAGKQGKAATSIITPTETVEDLDVQVEDSDVHMEDTQPAEELEEENPVQPTPSESEDGEASDVEEVERTILQAAQPIVLQETPATPTRAIPVTEPSLPGPSLPGPSLPIPAVQSALPLPPISNFTEAELSMTLEEWVRHETRRQYEVLRAEGERRIAEFVEKASVIRAKIKAL